MQDPIASLLVSTITAGNERELQAERDARAAAEQRAKNMVLQEELTRELSSRDLAPGAREQVIELWREELTVYPQGNSFAVRGPSFESVQDFVASRLARTDHAHFVRSSVSPTNNPATAPSPGNQHQPDAPAQPAEPRNLGEQIVARAQQTRAVEAARIAAVNPQVDLSVGFGLRGRR